MQGLLGEGRSASIDFFAIARICGEMTASGSGFFFHPALTIDQFEEFFRLVGLP